MIKRMLTAYLNEKQDPELVARALQDNWKREQDNNIKKTKQKEKTKKKPLVSKRALAQVYHQLKLHTSNGIVTNIDVEHWIDPSLKKRQNTLPKY